MKRTSKLVCGLVCLAAVGSAQAAGALPSGYTEVEYILGNGTDARIVTDYTPNPTTDKIEFVAEWPENTLGVNQAVWCARGSDTTVDTWTMFMLGQSGNNQFRFDYKSTVSVFLSPAVSVNTKYTVTVDRNAATWSGGTGCSHPAVSSFTAAGGPVVLFASYTGAVGPSTSFSNYGKHKLYSFKIWRSGELIHYFVPCKDSSSNATLVDICDNPATLTKSGTFTAGTEGHYFDDTLFTTPDDTLVIYSSPGNVGSPDPAYGEQTGLVAGDTFTVSCGVTVMTNGTTECIYKGWKLYDEVGNLITNGTETSFTYEHPTPAKGRRLEWQWKTRPVGADATDFVPTLCMTFNSQSLANTGTGTLTMKNKGTPTYVPSADGYAIDARVYTPWGDNVSGVITANGDSSIAVVAALGTTSCGILVHFRNSSNNAGILLRRGTTANQVVLTENDSTTALITVNDIENADTEYHLYVANILSSGVELYVDGEFVGRTASTPRANSMNSMQIGSRHGTVISPEPEYGGGLVDDVRVYASALDTEQMKALGDSLGLYSSLKILPIPDQFCMRVDTPEPGFTVTNVETGAYWDYGEGGVASGPTPFDVAYSFTNGYGTVTVTGKAGSEYEGEAIKRSYKLTSELLVNGGFESGNWAPGWTASGNYAVIDTSTSGYQPNQTTTFISGKYCAILQKKNVATQVFTNDSPYCAELSWKCKQRSGYTDIPYEVTIDGKRLFYEDFQTGTSEVHYRTVEGIVLQPGEHTLKFETFATIDRTLFLDNVSLEVVSKTYLEILPIPSQSCVEGPCRPECVVSNLVEGQSWRVGGDIVSAYFDVVYSNNNVLGVATVTATGKGDLEGEVVSRIFAITEDENVSTTDTAARRLSVGGNIVYVFTNAVSAQTITARENLFLVNALLVGGGGAGGISLGGGGGGGGLVALDGVNFSLAPGGTLQFTVGAGGKPSTSTAAGNGRYGGDTSISIGDRYYLVKGGGGGGNVNQTSGQSGGCGGGGTKGANGGAGPAGQGYAGAKAGANSRSGGGGGAGHAGYEYTTDDGNRAGNGGEGVTNDITGAWVYYGGGGGGGGSANGYDLFNPGFGGAGGGGNGGKGVAGDAGTDGLGGGGGGGGYIGDRLGGNGGSGTVILSFKVSDFSIDPIETQYLAPGGCFPEPVVRAGGTPLVKDTDYTVAYVDNEATGLATITVTGINTYAGKVGYVSFNIFSRYFAKPEVAEEGDGTSWATAMSVTNLFATLGTTTEPVEVWIATGTISAKSFSITNNANLTIRGGFAGTEETLAERQPGALTVFDGESTANELMLITTGADAELVIDRLKFCRARQRGFRMSGAGSLKAYDCVIEANGAGSSTVYGRGMNVQSDGAGSLVVSNCVFAGNLYKSSADYTYGGFGIYISNFANALVEDSTFVTNGVALNSPYAGGYVGYNGPGSAIYAIDTPITVRGSRFAGNVNPVRLNSGDGRWAGGTIALSGKCGGSFVDHCAFIGNTERLSYQGSGTIDCGGALVVKLNSSTDKVTVRSCTFAYNVTQGGCSAGGITVVKGDVDIANTVFWRNTRSFVTTVGYGSDVQVHSAGTANIRHSTVTTMDGTALVGAGLTYDPETVFAADPKLVTTTDVFTNLLTKTSSYTYYKVAATTYAALTAMDAHLLSPAGYVVNGGAAGPATNEYSPAIDAGDPAADYSNEPSPNGARLNLGAFGNTAEASCTAIGQPEANVEVLYPDGLTRPLARITMGLESGTAYSATVRLVCTTGGVTLADEIYYGIGNGQVLEYTLPDYLPVGTDYSAAVTITAAGAEGVAYNVTEPATGMLPPYYGKGGGPNVIHVRIGADCKMDGTSWTDAYPDLGTALNSAPGETITEIWLAVTNDYMTKAITLGYPLTIRGGFAGVENSPEERPEGSMTWLDGNNVYRTMEFSVPVGTQLTVERIRFSHSVQQELKKGGKGDLLVRDCLFTDSITSGSIAGRGIYATGGGTIAVTNCNFLNLTGPAEDNSGGGALYFDTCAAAYVDHCLFVTNGTSFKANGGWARFRGAAAYINATPTIFSNCRFAACGAALREAAVGGVVEYAGASGGSKLVNCAFVGNSDFQSMSMPAETTCAGAIACTMSAMNQTLDVENCTVAYNITQGKWNAAGITVHRGTVNLKNSIVYGNVRGWKTYAAAAGADIQVRPEGILNMSYSLVTGSETNYIGVAEGGTINIGDGVIYGDPLLVTTTNDFTSLFTDGTTYWYLNGSDVRAKCAAFDAHLRSPKGYMVDGELFKYKGETSPAIDAGDPTSDYSKEPTIQGVGYHGRRVNMGAYGNTAEAAMTNIPGFCIYVR